MPPSTLSLGIGVLRMARRRSTRRPRILRLPSHRFFSTGGRDSEGPWDSLDEAADKIVQGRKASDGEQKPPHQSWSSYMGTEGDGEDSPWASLDAFAGSAKDVAQPAPRPDASAPSWEEAAIAAAAAYATSIPAGVTPLPSRAEPQLTHVHPRDNHASMVDVSSKHVSTRTAQAEAKVYIPDAVLQLLQGERVDGVDEANVRRKGPVLQTAQLAGIMGAKRTSELIPLCHGLNLAHVDVQLEVVQEAQPYIRVLCTAKTLSSTGVEMEALTGASVASLTLWDMLKSVGGKEMWIDGLMVTRKQGGKSGDWSRE